MVVPVRCFLPRPLLGILLLGLGVRVGFLLVGAAIFYHSPDRFYFNGDSGSYMQSFENLWQEGHYTFDFLTPDAAFGRLPGYPFFYGLHRVLFGAALAPAATAWTQVILDSGAVLLVFKILQRLEPSQLRTAYLGALLYAVYPFIIVWVPIIGTEALSTDLTLLWLLAVLAWRPTAFYALLLGLLVALSLYVREYMGILLPITLLWVLVHNRAEGLGRAVRLAAAVAIGFGVLYACWPIRNYVLSEKFVWLKPRTAGYANQTPDVDEFYRWVHCWDANENPWLDSVLVAKGDIHFPARTFGTAAEAAQARRLVALARRCGTGFWALGVGQRPDASPVPPTVESGSCNEVISEGFEQLSQRFAERDPLRFWFDVPLQNLRKALFKNGLVPDQALHPRAAPPSLGLVHVLFGYRTLLLLLGWGGLLLGLRRQPALWLVLAVSGFQYVYICFIYRGLEMRYLLQSDVLLLLPAALLLGRWLLKKPRFLSAV